MGRDLTGVIVFAKSEVSAYKKARKIFKKLVRKHALGYFLLRDDEDQGHSVADFPAMKNLQRAMIVDRHTQSKGYRFVREVIRNDQAYNLRIDDLMELRCALDSITSPEKAKEFLASGKLTYLNRDGKRVTSTSLKYTMGNIGDTDKFVHGIYAQYWGKITAYYYLDWVLARDPEEFQQVTDGKKIAKIMKDPDYKIWVVPALSKT